MASSHTTGHPRQPRARGAWVACLAGALLLAGTVVAVPSSAAPTVTVWRVGRWHGIPGNVANIGAAVRAAHPGDWILIGPGDYHPQMDRSPAQRGSGHPAAVLITTPRLHLRGMDRNRVVVDGTKPGSPRCSAAPRAQDYGVSTGGGRHAGRNGIEVWKTDGVSIDNLTACNFLSGTAGSGNEIWWNGGDDSGVVGMGAWSGSYLSATSTFYDPAHPQTAALYGLFVSNSRGPGRLNRTYASNFSDSGYYIGACPDCNAVVNHAHAQDNALGYSGTNSGGRLLIVNSEFDHNKDGFDTNSQNSADAPSPQNGRCPVGRTGPTGTRSCWVFMHNYVHDNNNPNVPQSGDAAHGPVGTGISLAGARNDTVIDNRFVNNGSWGVLTTVFPDTGATGTGNKPCRGGVAGGSFLGISVPCLFDVYGNRVVHNTFVHNGFFGNPTNGDLADLSTPPTEAPGAAGDCFHGNTEPGHKAATSWPTNLQSRQQTCGRAVYPGAASVGALGLQVLCATAAFGPCPPGVPDNYPRQKHVRMAPLPIQRTMPDPCAGAPANPWCPTHPRGAQGAAATTGLASAAVLTAVLRRRRLGRTRPGR